MKTTIEIDDALLAKAKQVAAGRRQPLRELVEQGLRSETGKPRSSAVKRKAIRWVTVAGALPPATDLSDRESMIRTFGRPL